MRGRSPILRSLATAVLVLGFAAAAQAQFQITTTTLPEGDIATTYAQTLTTTGGVGAVTWTITVGALPPGMGPTITSTPAGGAITGAPTVSGRFTFTAEATDTTPPPAQTDTQALSIAVRPLITTASLPGGAVGQPYSRTLTTSPWNTVYPAAGGNCANATQAHWCVTSGTLPGGLTLSTDGILAGTPTASGQFTFRVTLTDSSTPVQTTFKDFTVVIQPLLQFQITTTTLLDGAVGVSYPPQTLATTGGTLPNNWVVIGGALPTGVTLSSGGTLGGTPSVSGRFDFTVRASDSGNPTQTATANLSIAVTPSITTTTLPDGAVGLAYSQTLATSTWNTPYSWVANCSTAGAHWCVTVGALPAGVTLSTAGVLAGTPTASGTFDFTVTLTDSSTPALTTTKDLSLKIQPALNITTTTLPAGVSSAFYSQQVVATGPTPVTWSLLSGLLPPGLSLTPNTGVISGVPLVAQTFSFVLQASAGTPPQTDQQSLQIVVNPALSMTTLSLPNANLSAYSTVFVAAGGVAPYTWSNAGSTLPPGLSLSSAGVLSGTPTMIGTHPFAVKVTDSYSPAQEVTRAFSLNVSDAVTITTLQLPHGVLNVPYSAQLLAVGGTASRTWTVTTGVLPAGLTLSSTTGLIQGTPTAPGPPGITITVTDSLSASHSRNFTLVIDAALPSFSAPGLPVSLNPTQLSTVNLALGAATPSPVTGKLVLTFTSKSEVSGDDPMTRFSTGTRDVTFTIAANTTTAVFPSAVSLLVGTVAGTITLAADIDNGPTGVPVATVEVAAAVPVITKAAGLRTTGGLEVQITGYASSRRITTAEFTFTVLVDGQPVPVPIQRNVDFDFLVWFNNLASRPFGSAFSFVQAFSVQGDTAQIQSVTVRLINAQGGTTSGVITFK